MQAQEQLKIAQLQASQLDELAEEENAQFEFESELFRCKIEEEHLKKELQQQI